MGKATNPRQPPLKSAKKEYRVFSNKTNLEVLGHGLRTKPAVENYCIQFDCRYEERPEVIEFDQELLEMQRAESIRGIPEAIANDAADAVEALIGAEDIQTSLELLYGQKGVPAMPTVEDLVREAKLKRERQDAKLRADKAPEQQNIGGRLDDKDKPLLGQHRVTLFKDHSLLFPELYLSVFIAGPAWEERMFAKMFARSKCTKARSLDECDVVVFTGGDDVDPIYYGAERHVATRSNKIRDENDIKTYLHCVENRIPMIGVCRGAQFGHVMNGGKLYQDVDNHNGEHSIWCIKEHCTIDKVSSVHHQMAIFQPGTDMQLLATSTAAKNRWRDPTTNDSGNRSDVEAFFYRNSCFLGVQGHPEYTGYNFYTKWFLDRVMDYIIVNPDVAMEYRGKVPYRRVLQEVVDQRKVYEVVSPTQEEPNVMDPCV